jgi:hypothetical protein
MGGFGGGAHIGAFGGGVHTGGMAGRGAEGFGSGRIGIGGHHAMHRFGNVRRGYYGYGLNCYDWYNQYPSYPWPPTCS